MHQNHESKSSKSIQASETISNQPDILHDFQIFLRKLGSRKSIASIKYNGEAQGNYFGITNCITALNKFHYKASFGQINLSEWKEEWLPIFAFHEDGSACTITNFDKGHEITTISASKKDATTISWDEFANTFSGFVILSRKMSKPEINEYDGHWFFSAFRSSRWLYFQVFLAAIISNFLALTTSIFTMTVYDRVIPNSAIESLFALSLGVVFALSCDFFIKMLRASFIDKASKRVDLLVSRKIFDRILTLDSTNKKMNTGGLASIVKEFETLREFFTSSTLVVLVDLPFVFFFVYVIWLIAGSIALVPMATVPLVILVGLIMQPFLARASKQGMESGTNKQSVIVEAINGLETIQQTGAGPIFRTRYQDAVLSQSNVGSKAKNLSQFIINFSASVQQYAQIGIIFYGVFLIQDGIITQGALIAAVILGGRAMAPLGQLANVLTRANNALAAYRSLSSLFQKLPNKYITKNSISRSKFTGSIELKKLTFGYDPSTEPLIDDVNLKIPAGQNIAIVGKMGSGKSTLAKLISGSLSPTNGSVLIDGIDIRQIDDADRVKNIGIMLQDPWLFTGSIRENIQLNFAEYSDEHIERIAKISLVNEFVDNIPEGYEYTLSERGGGLSGGQKQTINLARCLLHEPSVIILDEPTSAMDQKTESLVVDNLKLYCADKTSIIITHRNSILSICDRIIVMENGKIIADNTPAELGIGTEKK